MKWTEFFQYVGCLKSTVRISLEEKLPLQVKQKSLGKIFLFEVIGLYKTLKCYFMTHHWFLNFIIIKILKCVFQVGGQTKIHNSFMEYWNQKSFSPDNGQELGAFDDDDDFSWWNFFCYIRYTGKAKILVFGIGVPKNLSCKWNQLH